MLRTSCFKKSCYIPLCVSINKVLKQVEIIPLSMGTETKHVQLMGTESFEYFQAKTKVAMKWGLRYPLGTENKKMI